MRRISLILIIPVLLLFASVEEAIQKYLKKVEIGDPIEYKNLRIFPLKLSTPLSLKEYITLDQAMEKGYLKIKEVGNGEVNYVQIKNDGKEPVFILTGEMITGAKQDRMIKADILLPPRSDWIKVAVYCVEHGRWVAVSNEFKSGGLVVPNAVRQTAKIRESQTEVWAEISRTQGELGISSETQTARANYEDKQVQKVVDDYTKRFENLPQISKSTIGVVVSTGDRIICVDLFANNNLLRKFWEKLVKSYVMDAIKGEKSSLNKDDVEEIIGAVKDAKIVSVGTPGIGDLIALESNQGKGSALVYEKEVVHLDFFPNENSFIDDPDLRLDFRRDQRR